MQSFVLLSTFPFLWSICVCMCIYIYMYCVHRMPAGNVTLNFVHTRSTLPKVSPLSSVSNSDGLRLRLFSLSLFSILFLPLSALALILFYHPLALTVTCVSYCKYDCICKMCIEKWLMFACVYSLIILVNMRIYLWSPSLSLSHTHTFTYTYLPHFTFTFDETLRSGARCWGLLYLSRTYK